MSTAKKISEDSGPVEEKESLVIVGLTSPEFLGIAQVVGNVLVRVCRDSMGRVFKSITHICGSLRHHWNEGEEINRRLTQSKDKIFSRHWYDFRGMR